MRIFRRCGFKPHIFGRFACVRFQTVPTKKGGWIAAGLAMLVFVLFSAHRLQAACGSGNLSDLCSPNFGLVGTSSTLNVPLGDSAPTQSLVDQAGLLSSGPLLYPDYKVLEAEARILLDRSMKFRQDISPYRNAKNFNDLVRHFDEKSGFSASYSDSQLGVLTLQQRIDRADADLRRARDIYGVCWLSMHRKSGCVGTMAVPQPSTPTAQQWGMITKPSSAPWRKTPAPPIRNTLGKC